MGTASVDMVNHPPHYTQGKIEVLDFIEDQQLNFKRGQVVKYVCRAEHKGTEIQDLKKAQFYLNREIAELEAVIMVVASKPDWLEREFRGKTFNWNYRANAAGLLEYRHTAGSAWARSLFDRRTQDHPEVGKELLKLIAEAASQCRKC